MKSLFFLITCICGFSCAVFAQSVQAPIFVQGGSTTKITSTLDSAVALANSGDAIYLPGGTFNLSTVLDKQLFVFGTGWNADSSTASGETRIIGAFNVNPNSTGTRIMGVFFNGDIIFQNTVQSLSLERGRVNTISATFVPIGLLDIKESTVGYINIYSGSLKITNSIITKQIAGYGGLGLYLTLKNSIILNNYASNPLLTLNAEILNSIIFLKQGASHNIASGGGNYSMSNSLIIGEASRINIDTSSIGNVRQDQSFRSNVFVRNSGEDFSTASDYHTKAACNCADRGVYSGLGVFRATPPVHIMESNVQTTTNNNFLKFQFKIKTNN